MMQTTEDTARLGITYIFKEILQTEWAVISGGTMLGAMPSRLRTDIKYIASIYNLLFALSRCQLAATPLRVAVAKIAQQESCNMWALIIGYQFPERDAIIAEITIQNKKKAAFNEVEFGRLLNSVIKPNANAPKPAKTVEKQRNMVHQKRTPSISNTRAHRDAQVRREEIHHVSHP